MWGGGGGRKGEAGVAGVSGRAPQCGRDERGSAGLCRWRRRGMWGAAAEKGDCRPGWLVVRICTRTDRRQRIGLPYGRHAAESGRRVLQDRRRKTVLPD